MIPLEQARRFLLAHCHMLDPSAAPLADAVGCVAAHDVTSPEPLPAVDVSAMDGYAVRAADVTDTPVRLRVVGAQMAGMARPDAIDAGEAIRIMTGASVAPGADAVVILERTVALPAEHRVEVVAPVSVGANIRRQGEVIDLGDIVLRSGTTLTPAHAGILASLGIGTVEVVARPRVGVLSTGNEVRAPGESVQPGQIRDANRPMLLAWARRRGWTAVDLGTTGDDLASITSALGAASTACDAILTTGGVSVGDLDLVGAAFEELGGTSTRSMRLALKPGKPFAFTVLADSGVPVFGLPGNPAAALVSAELLVRPAIGALAGHPQPIPQVVSACSEVNLARARDGKLHALWAVAEFRPDGTVSVHPCGTKGSHDLVAASTANALVLLPDGDGVSQGGAVTVQLLDTSLG